MKMLQEIRKRKGISQKELSIYSNIKLKTIQSYEQKTKNIDNAKFETLIKLSIVLDCGILELLNDEELRNLGKRARL